MNEFTTELQRQATEKYELLSEEEITQYVKRQKDHLIKILLLGIVFLIGTISLILVAVFLEETNVFFIALIVVLGIIAIGTIVASCVSFMNSTKELAISAIKRELSSKVYKEVQDRRQSGEILDMGFKSDKIVELYSVGEKADITWTNIAKKRLLINSERKTFVYQNKETHSKEYAFGDILNYEVYENGNQKIKGTAGRTLIGWEFFGLAGLSPLAGALVGGNMSRKIAETCDKLQLLIRVNDIDNPLISIDLVVDTKVDKSKDEYKKIRESLQKACAMLEYMINNRTDLIDIAENEEQPQEKPQSLKKELQELKGMLDEGLITQEEYDAKKKKLLNL